MADQSLVQQVLKFRSQNMSNDEIAQQLLYLGYTNADIFDAMSQADVSPAYGNGNSYGGETSIAAPAPVFNYQPAQFSQEHSIDSNKIEEIAESIIEEKWNDLIDNVNKIVEWKSSIETRINSMDSQIKSLKGEFDSLQKAILGKISDTDSVMREVSTDIKALEQVFKKILPGFVENVNELSRITQKMKGK